ncbi:hypothetical protein PG994_004278 [Apiospora phragmitis]|uniref:Uncharacterized protein n=1 Tax=Apiospora phragmitis TaxID=2905665 RepID=A0ABR1VQ57_9PEZI
MLEKHNAETLHTFKNYVATYVSQHLAETRCPGSKETKIRSPFASLSGFTDDFATVRELCDAVRDGVFLDDSGIPYIPIAPNETSGVPWNAYLYDFFKHGDYEALIRANGVKRGDLWFRLKDFSLILAAITTSLAIFLNHADLDDAEAMLNVCGAGDDLEESSAAEVQPGANSDQSLVEQANDEGKAEPRSWPNGEGNSLFNVYRAFEMVRLEFDQNFIKVWA